MQYLRRDIKKNRPSDFKGHSGGRGGPFEPDVEGHQNNPGACVKPLMCLSASRSISGVNSSPLTRLTVAYNSLAYFSMTGSVIASLSILTLARLMAWPMAHWALSEGSSRWKRGVGLGTWRT